jgi:RIO kinase 1
MPNPAGLDHLVEEGIIDAVHARLMSGKEASVYVVERGGYLGAAKVYKAPQDRTFKKVTSYVEGRNQTRNTRDRRAMARKSNYGRELIEENWHDMEFRALRRAFDAGVRVPEPYFLYGDVLLMELIVNEEGVPASRVADFTFTPENATLLHQEIFMQVKTLLGIGCVHGDLSAYNVLMGVRGPTIIDLPQVVDVSANTNAAEILRRDLRNVTEHLARFDARLLRYVDCGQVLFQHFARGTLSAVSGPEEGGARSSRGGGGRRGRDADRGRTGRDKPRNAAAPRPDPQTTARPPHGPANHPDNVAGNIAGNTGNPPVNRAARGPSGRPPVNSTQSAGPREPRPQSSPSSPRPQRPNAPPQNPRSGGSARRGSRR